MKSPNVLAGETRRGGNRPFQSFVHGARVGLVDGKEAPIVDSAALDVEAVRTCGRSATVETVAARQTALDSPRERALTIPRSSNSESESDSQNPPDPSQRLVEEPSKSSCCAQAIKSVPKTSSRLRGSFAVIFRSCFRIDGAVDTAGIHYGLAGRATGGSGSGSGADVGGRRAAVHRSMVGFVFLILGEFPAWVTEAVEHANRKALLCL